MGTVRKCWRRSRNCKSSQQLAEALTLVLRIVERRTSSPGSDARVGGGRARTHVLHRYYCFGSFELQVRGIHASAHIVTRSFATRARPSR